MGRAARAPAEAFGAVGRKARLASPPDTLTGNIDFGFGHIPAGEHLTFWSSLQVNPTNVGHRSQRRSRCAQSVVEGEPIRAVMQDVTFIEKR